MALLTITPKEALWDFELPIPAVLGYEASEVLVPKGTTLARGHSKVPWNYQLWLMPRHFGLPVSWHQLT